MSGLDAVGIPRGYHLFNKCGINPAGGSEIFWGPGRKRGLKGLFFRKEEPQGVKSPPVVLCYTGSVITVNHTIRKK